MAVEFHTIAIPHDDILAGRLTMDVFAADLWEVMQGRAPDEYSTAERFFQKTYMTEGLRNLLAVVERRLRGEGGDPVIQVQTPFGGGKTHSLIALYHKAHEWGARVAVIVGTALTVEQQTLWGVMAEQLTGDVGEFGERIAPGRERLRRLLEDKQPVLILMDELAEYVTRAAGVSVGSSTLAAQTLAFIQELTEVVKSLPRACLVFTLPESSLERFDDAAEQTARRLQKIAGRMEKIYTPVQEKEISSIIRRRLFSEVDFKRAARVVGRFMSYAEKEGLLPAGVEPSDYRHRFVASYPFLPEVIDVLYHRWGSFYSFQRTRGVLRLLSLVVHSLRDARGVSYITLADFDLGNQEIRRELLKHIGQEFDSVIACDISDIEAGARRVDDQLGKAYRGLRFGTRVATTIFMHSFSGGPEHGATLAEIKRHAAIVGTPSSAVTEALDMLKKRVFYLHQRGDRFLFTNQPNLVRLILTRQENVSPNEVREEEEKWLKKCLKGEKFRICLWPETSADIPDTPDLKLVFLRTLDRDFMLQCIESKGKSPRVHRNTLFFLVRDEREGAVLDDQLRRHVALLSIHDDSSLQLTSEQRADIKGQINTSRKDLQERLRQVYRQVFVPMRNIDIKQINLGVPTYGESRSIDEVVYQHLRGEGEILERLAPRALKERYLTEQKYIQTANLAETWTQVPGALRVVSKDAWRTSIAQGVEEGLFGLGRLKGEEVECVKFKESASPTFADDEVIVSPELCVTPPSPEATISTEEQKTEEKEETLTTEVEQPGEQQQVAGVERFLVRVHLPKGKVSDLLGILNLLQTRFENIRLTIDADGGQLQPHDIETLREAFRQMGITIDPPI